MTRTVADVIAALPRPDIERLPVPEYRIMGPYGCRTGLAVDSMKHHMTDEGYQLFMGLGTADNQYRFHVEWHGLDVAELLSRRPEPMFTSLLIQDKREWEGITADRSRDPAMRFRNVEALRDRSDIFKGTVLKDAQHDPAYNRHAADEIGAHFWVTYYHPRIVAHLTPYTRPEHYVRTYHSLDRNLVPTFATAGRRKCLLSGAISRAYPLRKSLADGIRAGALPGVDLMPHPGYHRNGCQTGVYLATLNSYKVAICTSSRYGYAVRKIMEATACGCSVITDLPSDEVLPGIDGNLTRIPSEFGPREVLPIIEALAAGWDPYQQQKWAEIAKHQYDYRTLGTKLAADIENLRETYNDH